MRYPNIITIDAALMSAKSVKTIRRDGSWGPARPEGYPSFRSRVWAAWLVFTGRADALVWEDGQ